MDLTAILQSILIYALPVLLAITIHEAAHGYAARFFGDPTAHRLGRITLNPLKHIDPVGTVLMPALLYLATSGAFLFGYAKPVPVNFGNLRHPKRDMVWVALAGPASNFVQALAWALLLLVLGVMQVQERFFLEMASAGIFVNLILWAFNLLPLPPLDGGRVLVGLLPYGAALQLQRLERYGMVIVLVLVFTGVVRTYWISPLMQAGKAAIWQLLQPLVWLLG
ncbi:MAG: site-2 protease family protein [Comamonas sp.]|nr:site-2 protease family protein [Comamonas sp.]